jgi:hypothetical protein
MKYIQPKRMSAMRAKPIRVFLLFIEDMIFQNERQKYEKKIGPHGFSPKKR